MNDPRLNIGLQTKLTQKLLITPQLKQSFSLLQMPITELLQEVSAYIEENPALDLGEPDYDVPQDPYEHEEKDDQEKSLLESLITPEWDDYINEGNSNELSFTPLSEEDLSNYEQYLSSRPTLADHLSFQLKTCGLSEFDVYIGEEIIGNLSEDGYFRADKAEIAETCGADVEKVEEILCVIKLFEPAGIASETLAECVIAQLGGVGASIGEILQIKELFELYSDEIVAFKYDEIVKKSGLDRENIDELLDLIRRTDPRPGLNFVNDENSNIVPDVYIVRNGEDFDVHVNETGLPSIHINSQYLKAMKDESLDVNTRNYIEEKVKNAKWILMSLQKRQKSIEKVSRAIVEVQKEFLLKGEAYMKPLRLRDIAEATLMHESTVSRATAGKYAMTDYGLLELKSFFSKGMDSDDGDISTRRIKVILRTIIENEPIEKPYSDEKIVALLSNQGIDVARRTVAKYRDEMNIPTMSKRKRMRS